MPVNKFAAILVVRTEEGNLRRLEATSTHSYRVNNNTKAGPLKRALRLDQALSIVAAWDEDCNEGRSTLVSIDDNAIARLRAHAGGRASRIA